MYENEIVSVLVNKAGELEMVTRNKTGTQYLNGTPCPDKVQKVVYKAGADGRIFLDRVIEGTHTPAYRVAEKIEFPE